MLKASLQQLMEKKNLTVSQCEEVIAEILNDADSHQIAAFLVLLHSKGETAEELYGIVQAMRQRMQTIAINDDVLDIVGTGGDGASTVNISTASSILAASCGVKIAKHGNRSVSSQCGSADLLEKLGVNIDMPESMLIDCINKINIGFCFAPNYHPAMKKIKSIRTALNLRTTFNLLGPLLNPAKANYYLMGVYDPSYLQLFAEVLLKLQVKRAMVVHGSKLDELNLLGPSRVVEVTQGETREYFLDPKTYGFKYCTLAEIQGADAATNAKLLLEALQGKPGAIMDTLIFNAAVALYIAGKSVSIEAGIEVARTKLIDGSALNTLNLWVGYSKEQKNA